MPKTEQPTAAHKEYRPRYYNKDYAKVCLECKKKSCDGGKKCYAAERKRRKKNAED